jgi:GTP-binding protein
VLLALSKVDALDKATRAKKVRSLKAASGKTPMLVSAVAGEGVTEVLREAYAHVRRQAAEVAEVSQAPADWRP